MGAARKVNADVEPVPVHLSCLHTLLFRPPYPRLRDVMWCKWCSAEKTVIAVAETYGLTCDQCPRLNRRYGTDLGAARRAASRHVLRYPTHTMDIRRAGHYVERVTTTGTQDELPFERTLSERAAQVRENQLKLREMTQRAIDKAATDGNVRAATTARTDLHQEETP